MFWFLVCVQHVCSVCECVCVCVCFGGSPRADVDKVWPHESPVEKKMETGQCIYSTYVFSHSPPVSLYLPAFFFFNFTSSPPALFLPHSLFFLHSTLSLSFCLSLSHTHTLRQAIVHVLTVFWQYSSRNCFILSWRSTQSGSNCTVSQAVWGMKSRFPGWKIHPRALVSWGLRLYGR